MTVFGLWASNSERKESQFQSEWTYNFILIELGLIAPVESVPMITRIAFIYHLSTSCEILLCYCHLDDANLGLYESS